MTDSGPLPLVHIPEPKLSFNYGQQMEYPRDGLFLYGPVDRADGPDRIRYGVIGTKAGVARLKRWAAEIGGFIRPPAPKSEGRRVAPHHVPYPGFSQAFGASWNDTPAEVIDEIDPKKLSEALRIANRHEAIKDAVSMYVEPLIQAHNRLEYPPDFWFVVIPEEVFALGRPQSRVPREERRAGKVTMTKAKSKSLDTAPDLFLEPTDVYKYATHFRRQLKARLLEHRIVTQIVRETTIAPNDFVDDRGFLVRRVEDPATIAWKLSTCAYYKAGGRPWQLANVREGVCYVGLVYKHTDPDGKGQYACCAAQMFLTDGDGVVFRGAVGPWYSLDRKEFHLSAEKAQELISMVVDEYRHKHGRAPSELFIHAKSAFSTDEWHGFSEACPKETNLVGVQIRDAREDLKLFRLGQYPVLRGLAMKLSERNAYLWTAGYTPRLDTYMGAETPNPIQVKILRGDCDLDVVLQDVLGLTKINFNSCLMNDRLPVTIRFADAVGEVLVSAPTDGKAKLPFKFYI